MNWASSERVTNFLGKSVFTWNDVISAAKSFKECTVNHFLTNFQCFEQFQYWLNFCFSWLTLLSEFLKMNCASFERVTNFLEKGFFTRNDLVSAAKGSKHCTPNHFFEKFSVFWAILVQAKLSLFMSDATVRIGSNELCLLWKGGQLLRKKVFYLIRSGISCKKFQSVHR